MQRCPVNDGHHYAMKYIVSFILLASLFSCKTPRYIYTSSQPNNPFFTDKGQARINGNISGGAESNTAEGEKNSGYDLQAAWSFADGWAATLALFGRKERDVFNSQVGNFFNNSVVDYKRRLTEFAVGHYLLLNARPPGEHRPGVGITFNLYGGLGLGRFTFTDQGADTANLAYQRSHESRITKYFFQPSFNFMTGPYFKLGLVSRITFVHFGDVKTNYTLPEQNYFELDKLPGRTASYFEPAIQAEVSIPGAEWITVNTGFTLSTSMGIQEARNLKSRWFSGTIGLGLSLPAIKKASPR